MSSFACLCLTVIALITLSDRVRAQGQTGEIVAAADRFLATLTTEQRTRVRFDFDDAKQRARWSNFPTGFVPRAGISLGEMTAPQRTAAMQLLAATLSPMGLEKVNEIRAADDDFKVNGSKRGPRGGGRPPGPPPGDRGGPGAPPPGSNPAMFGSDLYYFSLLGRPSTTSPWMLQFGGHHLALNITLAGSHGVLTPTLTGAQPASFQLNGRTVRPVGRESDEALSLLQSLDETQRKRAVLNYTVSDLVLGPGQDGRKIVPEGLQASAMTPPQRAALLGLIGEWVDILNAEAATARMAEMKADLNETWFAWSGPTTGEAGSNIRAYYRIQGPHLVIEYAPQQDEPANHVHTMYRDPTNDYGGAGKTR